MAWRLSCLICRYVKVFFQLSLGFIFNFHWLLMKTGRYWLSFVIELNFYGNFLLPVVFWIACRYYNCVSLRILRKRLREEDFKHLYPRGLIVYDFSGQITADIFYATTGVNYNIVNLSKRNDFYSLAKELWSVSYLSLKIKEGWMESIDFNVTVLHLTFIYYIL